MLDLMTMKCDVITKPSGVFIAINDICCRMWQGGGREGAGSMLVPSSLVSLYTAAQFSYSLYQQYRVEAADLLMFVGK